MNEHPPSLLHQLYPQMMASGVKPQPSNEALLAARQKHILETQANLARKCLFADNAGGVPLKVPRS